MSPSSPAQRSLKVLVVEDESVIREAIAGALSLEGHSVREAADGAQALKVLATSPPDVVVLDLMMPTMDARSFREEQQRLSLALDAPLVLVSASQEIESVAELLGAVAALAKPFDLDELVGAVEQASLNGEESGRARPAPPALCSGCWSVCIPSRLST